MKALRITLTDGRVFLYANKPAWPVVNAELIDVLEEPAIPEDRPDPADVFEQTPLRHSESKT